MIWALVLILVQGCSPIAPAERRPNVVLVVVDTLRKDHLSLYGYERETSEQLERIASDSWTFENHISTASQTVPAMLSIMLSQMPSEHGFINLEPEHFARNRPYFPDDFLFLAEILSKSGYETAAFVNQPYLQATNGFAQGFRSFTDSRQDRGHTSTVQALNWLNEHFHESKNPFFLYLHYFDVHWPYNPPVEFQEIPESSLGTPIYRNGLYPDAAQHDVEASIALYDGAIAYVDQQIGHIESILKLMNVLEDTLLIITSDHGEEFLEHGGLGHGTTVFGELVRVPLLMRYPRKLEPGLRISYLTSQLDLAPTILELINLQSPHEFKGSSLLRPAAAAIAENGPWRAAYSGDHKLVINLAKKTSQIFRLSDETDQNSIIDSQIESRLLEELDDYEESRKVTLRVGKPDPDHPWQPEELEHLRTLGYLN